MKKIYVLGNCLRGYYDGRFDDIDTAWEVLSRRFLLSYPSTEGRSVQMRVRDTNQFGFEDWLICKDDKTMLVCSWDDEKVMSHCKKNYLYHFQIEDDENGTTFKKLKYDEYVAWEKVYRDNPGTYRIGQAFVNKYFVDGMNDPILFYCENINVARNHIMAHYVDFD